MCSDRQGDIRPLARTGVLHDESKHVWKIRLLMQPATGLTEIHALAITPNVPLSLQLGGSDRCRTVHEARNLAAHFRLVGMVTAGEPALAAQR